MTTIAPDGILLSEWHLLSGHCQTNLRGPAKVAGLKRSGRQLICSDNTHLAPPQAPGRRYQRQVWRAHMAYNVDDSEVSAKLLPYPSG
jgi:hypothetical protein